MPGLIDLGPIAQLRAGRLCRRVIQMIVGLVFFGVSLGMMIRGAVGVAPWDVLHAGITLHVPLSIGAVLTVTSAFVVLAWIPLRERPGLATILNPFVLGLCADLTIAALRPIELFDLVAARAVLMVGGIALCGFGSALYIGAQLGRGPRDGLMTGLARVGGRSLRLVRTAIEVSVVVLGIGFVVAAGQSAGLIGILGVGTILYAVGIGPLTQAMLPRWTVPLDPPLDPPLDVSVQRRVATTADASAATITSTAVNRSSLSHSSRRVSTRP